MDFDLDEYRREIQAFDTESLKRLRVQIGRNGETDESIARERVVQAEIDLREQEAR